MSGDTATQVDQRGHESPDELRKFVVRRRCEVGFDLCDSEYDSLLRVLSADGAVEYAKNDDHASCCEGRDDKEFRRAVNMHCPYAKVGSVTLEPGEYLVQVEGYSRYEGPFRLKMECHSDCG